MATINYNEEKLEKARAAFLSFFGPVRDTLKSRYEIDINEIADKAKYPDQLWGLIRGHWSKSLVYLVPHTDNEFSGMPEWNVIRLITSKKKLDSGEVVATSCWVEKGALPVTVPFEVITDENGIERVKYLPDNVKVRFSNSISKEAPIKCDKNDDAIKAIDPDTGRESDAHQRYRLTGSFGDLLYRVPKIDAEGKIIYDKNSDKPINEWVVGSGAKQGYPMWKDFNDALEGFIIINCSGKDNKSIHDLRAELLSLVEVKGALNNLEAANAKAIERGYKKFFRYADLLKAREKFEAGIESITKSCCPEAADKLRKVMDLPGVNIEYAFGEGRAYVASPSKFAPEVCLPLPYTTVMTELRKRYEMKNEKGEQIGFAPVILTVKQNGKDQTFKFPVDESVLKNLASGGLVKLETEVMVANAQGVEEPVKKVETVKYNVATMEVIRGISLTAAKKIEQKQALEAKTKVVETGKKSSSVSRKTGEKKEGPSSEINNVFENKM